MTMRKRFLVVGLVVFFTLLLVSCNGVKQGIGAAYVPDPTNRVRLNFNTDWKFFRGDSSGAEAAAFDDSSWENACLPHTVRVEDLNCSGNKNYQGICWYRRHFALDGSYDGRKVFVEFEAGMGVSQVWVNGTSLATHYGGYTPFTADLTPYVKTDGSENVMAVRLDNTDNPEVPPGRTQYTLDFCYFGGLYRDVVMHVTDPLHVTDAVFADKPGDGGIRVTYSAVSRTSATVRIRTNVRNDAGTEKLCAVKTTIVDSASGAVAAILTSWGRLLPAGSDFTFAQSTVIPNPKLWTPDAPNLYTVHTAVLDGSTFVDSYATTIGIRTVAFSNANGFQINGERLRFMGANRHQEFPYIGYAASNALQYRDAVKLKEEGFQFIRLCHYPQDTSFLDACDRLGIMVLEPIPGWQFVGGSTFLERSYQDMRDTMRRDRNHPSVICWELSLNESNFPERYAKKAVGIGHTELPGSWIGGWMFPNQYDVFLVTSQAGARTYAGDWFTILIDEYGDWEYGGNMSTSRAGRGADEAALLTQVSHFQESLAADRMLPWETGDALWTGIDYNRGYNPDTAKSGTMDLFRLPKFSYYLYQSQRDPNLIIPGLDSGPMIYIASRWTKDSPTDVTVFSNCDRVRLSLNGAEIAVQSPDTVPGLLHPPFTFHGVTFAPGELKAEGLIGGAVKAACSVVTPGDAAAITLAADTDGIDPAADGADIVIVHAYIRDAHGNLVTTDNTTSVRFDVTGPGTIVGADPAVAEAGIASALVRTTRTAGSITVTAASRGLTPGSVAISSRTMPEAAVPMPATE
jgi:beta-galactosidase